MGAQDIIKSHGISTFGDLKYDKKFENLSYVNVNAPKGGEISFWAFGSFDSMHPYTRKGRAGAYSSIFFESLLEETADEVEVVVSGDPGGDTVIVLKFFGISSSSDAS